MFDEHYIPSDFPRFPSYDEICEDGDAVTYPGEPDNLFDPYPYDE